MKRKEKQLLFWKKHLSLLILVITCFTSAVFGDAWPYYGRWVEGNYDTINQAKAAAIADDRPLIVLLSKENSCVNCLGWWNHALCDGVFNHLSGCDFGSNVNSHPIVKYAQDNKLILIHVHVVDKSGIKNRLQATQYRSYWSLTGQWPAVCIFHVKRNADTMMQKDNLLDIDQVDPIGMYPLILKSKINGVQVASDVKSISFENWSAILESFFNSGNEYWSTIKPAAGISTGYEDAKELVFDGDNNVSTEAYAFEAEQEESWFKFSMESGKRYWFKGIRNLSSNISADYYFYKAGTNGVPSSTATKYSTDSRVFIGDTDFYIDGTSTNKGLFYLKLTRSSTSNVGSVNFTLQTRRSSSTQGSGITMAKDSGRSTSTAPWTKDYVSAKSAGKAMVVAFVKDYWDSETLALEKYVQTDDFKSKLNGSVYSLVVLNEAIDEIANYTMPELVFVRPNGSIVGRMSYEELGAKNFTQFIDLVSDKNEESNNDRDEGAVALNEGTVSGIKIGGVDDIDWYSLIVNHNETWTFVAKSEQEGNVKLSIYDQYGNLLKAGVSSSLKTGVEVKYEADANQTIYVSIASDGIEEPIDYSLTTKAQVVNYEVEFGSVTRKAAKNQRTIQIPVKLTKKIAAAGNINVTVKINTGGVSEELYGAVRLKNNTKEVITWTESEKTSMPVKYATLTLNVSDNSTWDGYVVVPLELETTTSIAAIGEKAKMDVQVYSSFTEPTFLDGDTTDVVFMTDTEGNDSYEYSIACPVGYSGTVFWEVVKGQIPEGITLSITGAEDGLYKLQVNANKPITGNGSFDIKIYMLSDAQTHQIQGGTTLTINYAVGEATAYNEYGKVGTCFAGTLFEEKKESEDKEHGDVSGRMSLEVTPDGLKAKVETMEGEVEFFKPVWNMIDVEKNILTATMSSTLDNNEYTLYVQVDANGVCTDESKLTVNDGDGASKTYAVDFKALNWTEETLGLFRPYYTSSLEPLGDDGNKATTGSVQGYGALTFSVANVFQGKVEDGLVRYEGFLPDGKSVISGEAPLRYYEHDELGNPYGEFTVFENTSQDKWFGCVVRVLVEDDGIICIDCMAPHGVCYDAESNRMHYRICGSAFDQTQSLTSQLSGSNQYYIVIEKPTKFSGGGGGILAPRGQLLMEDGWTFGAADSLFGLALTYDCEENAGVRQGESTDVARKGTFSGKVALYSKEFGIENNYSREVAIKGVWISATTACCDDNVYPVGSGYFLFKENNDEENEISYPVHIYKADALPADNDDILPHRLSTLEINTVNGIAFNGNDDGLWSCADENRALLSLTTAGAVLALNNQGVVKLFEAEEEIQLSEGSWNLYHVDLSGADLYEYINGIRYLQVNGYMGESEKTVISLCNNTVAEYYLHPGWNLIAIPWNVSELAIDCEENFVCNYYPMTVKDNYYVRADGLSAGQAYWIYAKWVTTKPIKLVGIQSEQMEMPVLDEGWFFGADPGDKAILGWVWDHNRFVEANTVPSTSGKGGWWYIQK